MASISGRTYVSDKQPVALPASFFSDLLPVIDDLAELKVTIFAQAALQQKEGDYRLLSIDEFAADKSLMRGLAVIDDSVPANKLLKSALEKAVARVTLLMAEIEIGGEARRYYTGADDVGRALQQRIQDGHWRPAADGEIELLPPRPSIYGLYEDNVGVLTPMIVDSLKDAEATYPRGLDRGRRCVWRSKATSETGAISKRYSSDGSRKDAGVKKVGDVLDDANPTGHDNGKPRSGNLTDIELPAPYDFVCFDPANRDLPCPLCDGKGVITLDVPLSDPQFGKFQRCPNHPVEDDREMHERLRRFGES